MVVQSGSKRRRPRKRVDARVSIGFAPDTYSQIIDMADSKNISVAQIVRDAVTTYLASQEAVKNPA